MEIKIKLKKNYKRSNNMNKNIEQSVFTMYLNTFYVYILLSNKSLHINILKHRFTIEISYKVYCKYALNINAITIN